jgi:hypothetical protein
MVDEAHECVDSATTKAERFKHKLETLGWIE